MTDPAQLRAAEAALDAAVAMLNAHTEAMASLRRTVHIARRKVELFPTQKEVET